jgi:hypothetical protein
MFEAINQKSPLIFCKNYTFNLDEQKSESFLKQLKPSSMSSDKKLEKL